MAVPCGQCIGCRLEKSRQWALRVMHEASSNERNSFLTLTYEEAPVGLEPGDLQRFFKRMRKRGLRVRYYACGEYGEKLGRPHYHVCLFGEDFSFDREAWKSGLWISRELEDLWTHGHCVIGELSFESAAYVARYCTKKITGAAAVDHYVRVDAETGEAFQVEPEFSRMSRGGRVKGSHGIGYEWWRAFREEVVRDDAVLARGRPCKPPRYYDALLRAVDDRAHQAIKDRRKVLSLSRAEDQTDDRLAVREVVAEARLNSGVRRYEA